MVFDVRLVVFLNSNSIAVKRGFTIQNTLFDFLAAILIIGVFGLIAFGAKQMSANVSHYENYVISLSVRELPYYAFMTVLRIFIAAGFSLMFTLAVATLAAKNKKAEQIIIPILDILQSIPVLGYISFTVTFFITLFPHRVLGLELAVIFAIFTAQVWNMTFSMYQSLKTLPQDMHEASGVFGLSLWKKFWSVELPFAMPGLIWNTMMSVSSSWFFIVASEAISVGDIKYNLPGVGAYLAEAIKMKNLYAVGYSVLTMLIIIILYDTIIFRPIIAWSEKFKYEIVASQNLPTSWVMNLFSKAVFLQKMVRLIRLSIKKLVNYKPFNTRGSIVYSYSKNSAMLNVIWYSLICFVVLACLYNVYSFLNGQVTIEEVKYVFLLGFITLLRIVILVILATIIWVPIGVYIGLNASIARRVQVLIQFLAAFPVNILFPIFVIVLVKYNLNANIFLSILMILGTQWYILFNIIAGASAFPTDLREAAKSFRIYGWMWWKKIIMPGVYPYLITGMITATGNAWNTSIVAEAVSWGNQSIYALGLGSYIAEKTSQGDYPHITLGLFVMVIYVIFFNRMLWWPLYRRSEANMRLG